MQKLECHLNIKSEDLKAIAARSANIDASACSTIEFITGKPVTFNQVGGNHYRKYKIPPVEFIMKNNVPYAEGNVIKYVMRFRDKNGLEDLLKARQYLDMLIAAEYPNHKLND